MAQFPLVPDNVNSVAAMCVDAAIAVHRALGPGFKEAIYSRAFCLELDSRGIPFACEKPIVVRYREWSIPGQRIDLVVADAVLVEIKALPKLRRMHRSQVISYLRTTGLRVGLLMNFNVRMMKEGIQRIVL